MMLLIPVLMCVYTCLDISDTLWISYGSHLLTFIVKAVAVKAGFLLTAKNSLQDKKCLSICLIH